MGTSETLRAVIDAGRAARRLDELSTARVIGKIAEQVHLAQQRAGTGKAIGPITPSGITIDSKASIKLGLAEPTAFAYASPEQAKGGEGDRRSDVFSLGILMWEALTHRPLFEAESEAATKAAVVEHAIVAPSELNANVPAELGAICMKALARNTADRYQSAKVMAAEIEAVLDDAGYGNSDEKIAAFITNLGATAKTRPGSPSGKLATSVATAALPPVRRPGVTNSPLAVPTTSQLPSVLKHPAVGPATPAPATVPDVGVPSTAPGFAGAPGMTPVPSDTPLTTTTPGPVATLIGTGGGPLPALLPPPPNQPRLSPDVVAPTIQAPSPPRNEAPAPIPAHVGRPPTAPPHPGAERAPTAPPHPANAVALPAKGRENELLGGWGWGTGAHPKVEDQDDLHNEPPPRNPMPYIIGGGIAVASVIVAVIMVLGGGKRPTKKAEAPRVAAAGTSLDPHSVNAPHDAAPTEVAIGTPDAVSASASSNNVAQGSSAVGSGANAEPTKEPGAISTPDAGLSSDGPIADTTPAKTPVKPATTPVKPATTPVKPTTTPQAVASTSEKPKHPAVVPSPKPNTKAQNAASTVKRDAETPYRRGLQLFMRGDTSGALTALRSSLAANSNYAPAWRAMGLVFEKQGDKDQARRAFRRYLQLAAGANDAEQVRNRLERLGP